MFINSSGWKAALGFVSIVGSLVATGGPAWAAGCAVDCLRVSSIVLQDLGSSLRGTVKLIDETGSAGAARSSVVHGVWTLPDGSSFDQYANIGTRLRAEFKLYTAGAPGTYTLTVAGLSKSSYTFDPDNSVAVSDSIGIGGVANQPPLAVANADVMSGGVPLDVQFDSAGSRDPDGQLTGYLWSFGDGETSTEANPQHSYMAVGHHVATLTVTDDQGARASQSLSIAVEEDAAGCVSNCITVDSVTLVYRANVGKVKGRVLLRDENGDPVADARVRARWTRPDGSVKVQTRDVASNQRANFGLEADAAGTYELTVLEVTRTGYVFDIDNSNVLGGMIDVAP